MVSKCPVAAFESDVAAFSKQLIAVAFDCASCSLKQVEEMAGVSQGTLQWMHSCVLVLVFFVWQLEP